MEREEDAGRNCDRRPPARAVSSLSDGDAEFGIRRDGSREAGARWGAMGLAAGGDGSVEDGSVDDGGTG